MGDFKEKSRSISDLRGAFECTAGGTISVTSAMDTDSTESLPGPADREEVNNGMDVNDVDNLQSDSFTGFDDSDDWKLVDNKVKNKLRREKRVSVASNVLVFWGCAFVFGCCSNLSAVSWFQ